MQIVAEAEDGDEAIEMHRRLRPDVTLMDLRMPRMSGHEATAAILKESPGSRIIILSGFSGDEDVKRALAAGACSYLLKDTPRAALVDAIRAVHRGESPVSAAIAAGPENRPTLPVLSERERDVLALVARVKTNREIAEALYISEGAAKSHVVRLIRKWNVGSRVELVTRALQRGIITRDLLSQSKRGRS
jgi:two-component system NarL family response regulator